MGRKLIRLPVQNIETFPSHDDNTHLEITLTKRTMLRSLSRDSFTTLIEENDDNENDDLQLQLQHENTEELTSDLISLISQETLINTSVQIMNQNVSQFNKHYELPLILSYLHTGVSLYLSFQDLLNNKPPLLTRTSSMMNINNLLRRPFRNSSFLTIHKHESMSNKFEFCHVDFKIHSNHITYYILKFPTLDETIYLINNNSSKPTVDFEYKKTCFRITGVTGTTSVIGVSPEIKLYVMNPNSKNLLTYNTTVLNGKKLQINNGLSKLVNSQDQSRINEMLRNEKPVISIPMGRYLDQGDAKLKLDNSSVNGGATKHKLNVIKHGVIRLFDYKEEEENAESNTVSNDMLVLCCVLLVLREQEYRKFKSG